MPLVAYAYVAAGKEGLAIVDVERPEAPRLLSKFTTHPGTDPGSVPGAIDDARDVVVGSTATKIWPVGTTFASALLRQGLRKKSSNPTIRPFFYALTNDRF